MASPTPWRCRRWTYTGWWPGLAGWVTWLLLNILFTGTKENGVPRKKKAHNYCELKNIYKIYSLGK